MPQTLSIKPMIRAAKQNLFSAEDRIDLERAELATEAYRRFEDRPPPLRRALTLRHILRHMTLDLESNPVFAGNTSPRPRAWMLLPEHGFEPDRQVLIENDGLDHIMDGVPARLREFWHGRSFGGGAGIGHLAVDMNRVVHDGLEKIAREIEAARDGPDPKADAYREAMALALRAVIEWAGRYSRAAAERARSTEDPPLREAYRRVARACRQVPARPARSLFEGLQAMVLAQLAIFVEGQGMSVSLGLPDRVLAPFAGEGFDREQATNLLCAFILKLSAVSLFGRGSKTQAVTVGGRDARGRD